jgi:hypothetical protein
MLRNKIVVMKNPILIVGAARSGTSLVAGTLHYSGVWYGKPHTPADEFNKKGYFENPMLFGELRACIARHDTGQFGIETDLRDIQTTYRIPDDKPWLLKMPEIVAWKGKVEWPLWDKHFPKAKWVIVQRDINEIFHSHVRKYGCIRPDTDQIIEQLSMLQAHLKDRGNPAFEIWPLRNKAMQVPQLKKLSEFIGLEWPQQKIENFIYAEENVPA